MEDEAENWTKKHHDTPFLISVGQRKDGTRVLGI